MAGPPHRYTNTLDKHKNRPTKSGLAIARQASQYLYNTNGSEWFLHVCVRVLPETRLPFLSGDGSGGDCAIVSEESYMIMTTPYHQNRLIQLQLRSA